MRGWCLVLLVACADATPSDEPVAPQSRAPTNAVPMPNRPRGEQDASLCPRDGKVALRCRADNSPRFGLAVCDALVSEASVSVASDVHVSDDAHLTRAAFAKSAAVGGTVAVAERLSVGGELRASAIAGGGDVEAATQTMGPSEPIAACRFTAVSQLDAARAQRDVTAEHALPADALRDLSLASTLHLGCGRYLVSQIETHEPLTLRVSGDTVLVVERDAIIDAPLSVEIEDGGSFELIVGGAMRVEHELHLGDEAHPVSVTVAGALSVAAPLFVFGALASMYQTTVSAPLRVAGSLLSGPLDVSAALDITGEALLDARGCATF